MRKTKRYQHVTGWTWKHLDLDQFCPNSSWHWHEPWQDLLMHVALLWALPTSQKKLAIGSDWEMAPLVVNCKLQLLSSLEVPELKLKCKNSKKSKWKFLFSANHHIDPPNSVFFWTRNNINRLSTWSNLIITRDFLMSVLHTKSCHVPLKCRC